LAILQASTAHYQRKGTEQNNYCWHARLQAHTWHDYAADCREVVTS